MNGFKLSVLVLLVLNILGCGTGDGGDSTDIVIEADDGATVIVGDGSVEVQGQEEEDPTVCCLLLTDLLDDDCLEDNFPEEDPFLCRD